jgi:hypothetical protein
MRNAQYLRAQAEFCLEVARQMSDDKIIDNLQAEAARYHAEAVEVEAEQYNGPASIDLKTAGRNADRGGHSEPPHGSFSQIKKADGD